MKVLPRDIRVGVWSQQALRGNQGLPGSPLVVGGGWGAKASLQPRRPCRGLMTVARGVVDMKEQRNHVLGETALPLGP